jgi:hypothetical protein
MNRPTPSLAILAIVAVALALIFFGRNYLSPHGAPATSATVATGP